MNEHHVALLQFMHDYDPDYVVNYRNLKYDLFINDKNNIDINYLKKLMKYLRTEGYVWYTQAFSFDDNLVCGSGHQITDKGKAFIKNYLKENPKNVPTI